MSASYIKKSLFAIAFDIDGVLLRGKLTLQSAPRALQLLRRSTNPALSVSDVPFVLLTNGGGVTEAMKAQEISEKVGLSIAPEQVILSHTPMQSLVPKFADRSVLFIGKDECKAAALQYGFRKPLLSADLMQRHPGMWPYSKPSQVKIPHLHEPLAAVMVFHDSQDWGRDLQILSDVLLENGASPGERAQLPLFFSNPDFLWSNDFPEPRYGQGAFKEHLKHIMKVCHLNILVPG